MTAALTTCPTPAEFSALYARAKCGDSGAMDARNNLVICGIDTDAPHLVNRNGDFAKVYDVSEAQLYFAVVTMLCAEEHGFKVRGDLPYFDHAIGRFAA